MVLAAGLARRFGGPKQLEGFGPDGELLLDYTLRDASRAGFDHVVLVVRAEHEEQLLVQARRRHPHLTLSAAHQRLDDLPAPYRPPTGRTKPWGTLHALLAARAQLAGPFVVANADDHYGPGALAALGEHLAVGGSACLVPYLLGDTLSAEGGVSRAIVDARDGALTGLREVLDLRGGHGDWVEGRELEGQAVALAPDTPVSMNLWGFPGPAIPLLHDWFTGWLAGHADSQAAECYLSEAVGALVESGALEVRVLPTASGWLGVTHPGDADAVRRALARGG